MKKITYLCIVVEAGKIVKINLDINEKIHIFAVNKKGGIIWKFIE